MNCIIIFIYSSFLLFVTLQYNSQFTLYLIINMNRPKALKKNSQRQSSYPKRKYDCKTDYPYSRLRLFQQLKISPKDRQNLYRQKQCIFVVKQELDAMDQFGYDFCYSAYKPTKEFQRKLPRKVKLRFFCEDCKKPWTTIVGTIVIKFNIDQFQIQGIKTHLVNFRVILYKMKCITCRKWGIPSIYESQLVTVSKIFCLTISEILAQVPRPFKRIKDDRHKMKEETHDHKEELCEACQAKTCFARPKVNNSSFRL